MNKKLQTQRMLEAALAMLIAPPAVREHLYVFHIEADYPGDAAIHELILEVVNLRKRGRQCVLCGVELHNALYPRFPTTDPRDRTGDVRDHICDRCLSAALCDKLRRTLPELFTED